MTAMNLPGQAQRPGAMRPQQKATKPFRKPLPRQAPYAAKPGQQGGLTSATGPGVKAPGSDIRAMPLPQAVGAVQNAMAQRGRLPVGAGRPNQSPPIIGNAPGAPGEMKPAIAPGLQAPPKSELTSTSNLTAPGAEAPPQTMQPGRPMDQMEPGQSPPIFAGAGGPMGQGVDLPPALQQAVANGMPPEVAFQRAMQNRQGFRDRVMGAQGAPGAEQEFQMQGASPGAPGAPEPGGMPPNMQAQIMQRLQGLRTPNLDMTSLYGPPQQQMQSAYLPFAR